MGLSLVGSGVEPTPALSDIPGMLREAANRLESGEDEMPCTFVWVTQYADGGIAVGAFGDAPSKCEVVGMLHLAAGTFGADAGDTERG